MVQIFTAWPVTSNLIIKKGHRLGHIHTDIDWIILIWQKSKRPQNQWFVVFWLGLEPHFVGVTGFELATPRPPDEYSKPSWATPRIMCVNYNAVAKVIRFFLFTNISDLLSKIKLYLFWVLTSLSINKIFSFDVNTIIDWN